MRRRLPAGARTWAVFLLAGTAIAVLVHVLLPPRQSILVDGGQVARVLRWEQDVRGRSATAEERREIIHRLEDEAILLAEARRRGHLDRGYVRGRLLKKMRFLLAEDLVVPSDAEMRAVYDANLAAFRQPGALAFEQVFFRADSTALPEDAEAFRRRLEEGEDRDGLGEAHPLGRAVGLHAEADLVRRLGVEATRQLFAAPLGTWVGPVASSDGIHYVRVKTRSDPAQVPFEEALPRLRGAWTLTRQREAIARRTEEILRAYRVRIGEAD